MSDRQAGHGRDSMTLITEMMERPLDPGYAAAAQRREQSGLPAATGRRSLLLITVAVLIGALLGVSALALRAPTTAASEIKQELVVRIENKRAHGDAQTRLIAALRNQINTAQASALSQQSQTGLAADLLQLELAAGTVPVSGPGLVLTLDDAPTKADPAGADANPRTAPETDEGKVISRDVQQIVNGLWDAGAEAVSVNGHRLTARSAIRSAGSAILVGYGGLTRPYVISAIGDPGSLSVDFAESSGGSYLHSLATNQKIRDDIQERSLVVVPGEPTLSVQLAKPAKSAVTSPRTAPTTSAQRTTAPRTSAPRTTETSP